MDGQEQTEREDRYKRKLSDHPTAIRERKRRVAFTGNRCVTCGREVVPGFRQCKICKDRAKKYYYNNLGKIKEWQKVHRLSSSKMGGSVASNNFFKRRNPGYCEICKRRNRKLSFHHWDSLYLEKGIWVCIRCHNVAEFIDEGLDPMIYINFRNEMDEEDGRSGTA